MEFIERKITNPCRKTRRKLKYNVATNDADYIVDYRESNKRFICPIYSKWVSMIMRCYCHKYHKKQPTYKDCFVCDEWLLFSNFKEWMINQAWKGKELDKDLLVDGNKEYSPTKCLFIDRSVNQLIRGIGTGIGFVFLERTGTFKSSTSLNGRSVHLGYFKKQTDAYEAYKEFKIKAALEISKTQSNQIRLLIEKAIDKL